MPNDSVPRNVPVRPGDTRTLGLTAAALVFATLLGAFALVNTYERRLRQSPVYATALDLTSRSAEAQAALGGAIKASGGVHGWVDYVSASGSAILAIPVSGAARRGTIYAVANRAPSGWDISRLVLHAAGLPHGRLDLTPPTQPDAFQYPASGRVYLLPLDEASASDLAGLPEYYKARLGLDVRLMPTQKLALDPIDPKSTQVAAEQILASIAALHPEIAEDLDSEILAVTSQDMTIKTAGWQYAVNYRHGRFGVISTAHLHGVPWLAGDNPEVYPVRVRKMVTKNVALLHYPLETSSDDSSVLAFGLPTVSELDRRSERIGGISGHASSEAGGAPCVNVTQGPNGKQSWRLGCVDSPPSDSRFETFENYTGLPLIVMSRADFVFKGEPAFSFVRAYRPKDDRSRSFGIGSTDSFDILPVGDSQTFSWIELTLTSGARIHFNRTSLGSGVAGARFRARSYMGSPFSLSSLVWNGNGWDVATQDGWTYRFPSSGPDRTWQQSALTGIRSASGKVFSIERGSSGDLRAVRGPEGDSIEFEIDGMHRISSAKESSGRVVEYGYDQAGRLVHLRDAGYGDEFYEYDSLNQLTSVQDGQHRPLVGNTYDEFGRIRSQSLTDGRKLLYECGYNENHQLASVRLILPNGYVVDWMLTRNGFVSSMPHPPANPDSTSPR